MSLLVIQTGQRQYPFKTQANWVFDLNPVRGNKLKKKKKKRVLEKYYNCGKLEKCYSTLV